jgi:hypothetical protein
MLTKPEDVGLSSERLARVNAWAQRLVDAGKPAGIITVVRRHGEIHLSNSARAAGAYLPGGGGLTLTQPR